MDMAALGLGLVSRCRELLVYSVFALDIVRGAPRDGEIRLALVNAFGFGGQNAALLLAKWEGR